MTFFELNLIHDLIERERETKLDEFKRTEKALRNATKENWDALAQANREANLEYAKYNALLDKFNRTDWHN